MDKAEMSRQAEAISEKRKREEVLTHQEKILLLAHLLLAKKTRREQGYAGP